MKIEKSDSPLSLCSPPSLLSAVSNWSRDAKDRVGARFVNIKQQR